MINISDNLTALDILRNNQLCESTINAVTTLRSLKALNLDGLSIVSDGALSTIAEHCPNSLVLDLWEARGYTDNGLKHIQNRCVKLQRLIFRNYKMSVPVP